MSVVPRETPVGTKVQAIEPLYGNRTHQEGATGKIDHYMGSRCVIITWDDGLVDTYGYFCRRLEIMGGPW